MFRDSSSDSEFTTAFSISLAALEKFFLSYASFASSIKKGSWPAVSGATSYRVEASNDPYGTYTTLGSTSDLSYNFTPTEDMKFFRVIAIN